MNIGKSNFAKIGKRAYLHSTTLWNYTVRQIFGGEKISRVQMLCRKMLINQAEIFVCDDTETIEDYSAQVIVDTEKGRMQVFYKETSTEVVDRVPYDEEALVGNSKIDEEKKEIAVQCDSIDLVFNYIVAGNKKLLLKVLDNEGWTSWVVAKSTLNLQNLVDAVSENKNIRIVVDHIMNNQYTRSSVYVGDLKYGNIEFARTKG